MMAALQGSAVLGRALVLDTNIVLDLLVFHDPATPPLKQALDQQTLRWLATAPMREELARVLSYPQIVKSLAYHGVAAAEVLAGFDAQASLVTVAPKASVTCKDVDDQKFIDLAVQHQALLLSKDKAVLCMKKRLLAQKTVVLTAMESIAV
ncbi:putative toxin-antitoxin system toxin component, PIN family [Rhodoferax sp.]|uniref:putative toxin-antitoxin system toxin component, PIN family n=1 Tax=Rhodoferax sp. TaxID=50421 RepID=UPI00262B7698|nr:putative toxin-antitoxin system toxin component, PIN family [Rhodoferax sp.]MDD2927090.1 putative toxin-antitoxin system toxin component, PIN family [Rhodoferax sp.]